MKFFVIYIEAKGWQSYLLKKKFLKVSIFIYLDIFGEDTSTIIFINPNLRNNNYIEQDNVHCKHNDSRKYFLYF